MHNMKWVVSHMLWSEEEDDWKKGCDPTTITERLSESSIGVFDSFAKLKEHLCDLYGLPEESDNWAVVCSSDGVIDVQFHVNKDHGVASEDEIEQWKKGGCRLWLARVTLDVLVGDIHIPDADELEELTGLEQV